MTIESGTQDWTRVLAEPCPRSLARGVEGLRRETWLDVTALRR